MAESLRDETCTSCKLGQAATSPTQVCIMQTKPDADLMVVTKTPFSVKQQESFLRQLDTLGIDRKGVMFSAVTRCKVWDLEAGKVDQRTCAEMYLKPEIERVKPKLIIALGNEALLATTGRTGIMKYRGQTLPLKNIDADAQVFATISPSMVKRSPGMAAGFEADLRFANSLRTGKPLPGSTQGKTFIVKTSRGLDSLVKKLGSCGGLAFDIETTGFNEYDEDAAIVSLSLTVWGAGATEPECTYVVPLYHPQSPFQTHWRRVVGTITKAMAAVPKRVAHNGKFDLRWLRQHHGHWDPTLMDDKGRPLPMADREYAERMQRENPCPVCNLGLTFDTMLAQHLIDENVPKGLKPMAQTRLGAKPWAISTKNLLEDDLKTVLKYNGLDTWYTALLYFQLHKELMEQPRLAKLMASMMVPASNYLTGVEKEGLWTDREQLDTRAHVAKTKLEAIDRALLKACPPKEEWPEKFQKRGHNFNPSDFCRWLLFDYLEMPVYERGKNKPDGSPGNPSMAEGVLLKLKAEHPHPILNGLLARSKWQKYSSAFFSAYQEQIDSNDRIHTTFKLTGTVTGRLSSGKGDADKVTGKVQARGVNLQQVPRDPFVKGIFGAPPGSVFVECDYSQAELRIAAFLAQDKNMLHLYATGQDIHTHMAQRMTGRLDVTKDERKKAKAVNFGFLYGMGWKKFIETAWNNYGVVVSEQEAQAFRKAFFQEFPELPRWHQRQRSLAAKYKRVESPIGRVRHLPDIDSDDQGKVAEAQRQAINSVVQSFASDMTLLALVRLSQRFERLGLRAHSVGTVHDAINFEVPIEELTLVVPMIKHEMENLPLDKLYGVDLTVPIQADVALGKMWGDKVEIPGDISIDRKKLRAWVDEHYEEVGIHDWPQKRK